VDVGKGAFADFLTEESPHRPPSAAKSKHRARAKRNPSRCGHRQPVHSKTYLTVLRPPIWRRSAAASLRSIRDTDAFAPHAEIDDMP
jgi:hypothetical protein